MREVPLPRDHEGREIPLDTEVMYDWRGTKEAVAMLADSWNSR